MPSPGWAGSGELGGGGGGAAAGPQASLAPDQENQQERLRGPGLTGDQAEDRTFYKCLASLDQSNGTTTTC